MHMSKCKTKEQKLELFTKADNSGEVKKHKSLPCQLLQIHISYVHVTSVKKINVITMKKKIG